MAWGPRLCEVPKSDKMCDVQTSCQETDLVLAFGKRCTYQNSQCAGIVLDLAFEALYSLLLEHCALRRVQVETFKLQGGPGCRNCNGRTENKLHGGNDRRA